MARDFEYDVALSFAGEERGYAEQVAAALTSAGVSVFYDDYKAAELWGKDLYSHLDAVYRKRARFCVMFISASYGRKLWTNHERRSAQARAFEESNEYIWPVRFDETEIPGVRPTLGYVDARRTTPEQVAAMVVEKLGMTENSDVPEVVTHRRPRLAPRTFNPYEEAQRLIEIIGTELEARAESLRETGVSLSVFERRSHRCFRFVYRGDVVYSLDVWMGDSLTDKGLSFLGTRGECHAWGGGSNAIGEVIWSKQEEQPVLKLMDFSLLGVLSSADEQYTYDRFVDALWEQVCDALEAGET